MVIIGHRYSIYVILQQLLLLLICRIASSNGESVWNQLHDHTKAAHIKAQQQRQRQSSSDGDMVYDYPNLFTTTKDVKLEPVTTTASGSKQDDDDDDSTTTTKARKGDGKMMMSMSMKSDPSSSSPVSIPTSSPSISLNGKGGGMMMMSSSNSSPAPSTSGKGGMMKSTSPPKTSSPSTTIVPSYSPTTSDDDGNNGKGKGRPKTSKSPTPSKKSSKSPTSSKKSSKSPTVSGKGKGKKGDDIEPTSSPTATAVPTVTAVPTYGGKMGMMMSGMSSSKEGMGGKGMSSSKSSSPVQAPTPGMKKGKGGMDGMSKSKITPSPTSTPSLLPTAQPFPSIPTAPTQPSNRVQLSPYTLQYTFVQTRVPNTFEVEEVVMITRLYLADYFEIRYPDIMEFVTNITGSLFSLQRPFTINYTSTAIFNTMRRRILNEDDDNDDNDDNDDVSNNDDDVSEDDDSGNEIAIPPVEELDIVLIAAFTGANLVTYVNLLADLPPENIFRNTTAVTFALEEVTGDSTTNATNRTDSDNSRDSYQGRSAKIPGGIAAGVTGVVVIVAFSIMIARHRKINHPNHKKMKRSHQYNDTHQKRNPDSDDVDDEAHMTVAGDTCVADSTVVSGGNASLLSSTYGHRRFFTRRILSQSREVVTHSRDEAQLLSSLRQSSDMLNSDLGMVSVQRGISDILRDRDNNDCSFNDDDDDDTHDEDDRSLLPFYCTSPEPAYRGALSEDVHDKRDTDMLLTQQQPKRDDMKLPRHYHGQQEFDDIPNAMHHDIDEYNNHDDDDDDTLSVDDDVPLRVIDLIRKFTPTKKQRRRSR